MLTSYRTDSIPRRAGCPVKSVGDQLVEKTTAFRPRAEAGVGVDVSRLLERHHPAAPRGGEFVRAVHRHEGIIAACHYDAGKREALQGNWAEAADLVGCPERRVDVGRSNEQRALRHDAWAPRPVCDQSASETVRDQHRRCGAFGDVALEGREPHVTTGSEPVILHDATT